MVIVLNHVSTEKSENESQKINKISRIKNEKVAIVMYRNVAHFISFHFSFVILLLC